MGGSDHLDHHLVHGHPHPLYMGELPGAWEQVPAPVVVNLCGVYPHGDPEGRLVLGDAPLRTGDRLQLAIVRVDVVAWQPTDETSDRTAEG